MRRKTENQPDLFQRPATEQELVAEHLAYLDMAFGGWRPQVGVMASFNDVFAVDVEGRTRYVQMAPAMPLETDGQTWLVEFRGTASGDSLGVKFRLGVRGLWPITSRVQRTQAANVLTTAADCDKHEAQKS